MQTAVELHDAVANANSPRQLRTVLREGALRVRGHNSLECETCNRARARVDDKATELHARVEHDLSWHAPATDAIGETLDRLRVAAKNLAHEIVEATPPSREQSRGLTAVEDALQHAIAAVVRNQD